MILVTDTNRLVLGDCREVLPTLPGASFDCVVTDPPYAEVDRAYGRLSERDWRALMDAVVPEVRRVLKPRGSALFVLQPNSEHLGRLRPWLYRWMADMAEGDDTWGIVQDAWWWNHAAAPTAHCQEKNGLMRPSVKACVWLGPSDCYRNQGAVLWTESEANAADRLCARAGRISRPSGQTKDALKCSGTAERRGGVTPFNLLPICNADSSESAGAAGHGARTPAALIDWWLRYLCPEGGSVLDPFGGSGTTALVALRQGKAFTLIEQMPEYVDMAERRIRAESPLFHALEVVR